MNKNLTLEDICSIKILLQEKIPEIRFIEDINLQDNVLDKYYYVNELKALVSTDFVKYQKPLLANSPKDIYPNICKYAQRLHYERQLHLEGVIYGALTINSKIDKNERFSNKDIYKKAYQAFSNVQTERRQKLLEDEFNKQAIINGSKGGVIRGEQKKMKY